MNLLFIGGTGTISTDLVDYAIRQGAAISVLNRGNRAESLPADANLIQGDMTNEADIAAKLACKHFDVIVDFISFVPADIERAYRLFAGKTAQYVFISSATVYEKPPKCVPITEETPLGNPFWDYAQNKESCERKLAELAQTSGFPYTIIRPSHTYCNRSVPVAIHGDNGSFQVIARILAKKPIIIPGDGTSLWTLTHSRDFAPLIWPVFGNAQAIGEAYHVTSSQALSWNEIHDQIGYALGQPVEKVHIPSPLLAKLDAKFEKELLGDKAHSLIFDNTKVRSLTEIPHTCKPFTHWIGGVVETVLNEPRYQPRDPAFDTWCDETIDAWQKATTTL